MQSHKRLFVVVSVLAGLVSTTFSIAAQESANPVGFKDAEVKESQNGPVAPGKLLLVEAAVLVDSQVVASPKLKIFDGRQFTFQVGEIGHDLYTVQGTSTIGADGKITTDFVFEITQWQGESKHVRRMQQAIKVDAGEALTVGGIRNDAGKQVGLKLTVRPIIQD